MLFSVLTVPVGNCDRSELVTRPLVDRVPLPELGGVTEPDRGAAVRPGDDGAEPEGVRVRTCGGADRWGSLEAGADCCGAGADDDPPALPRGTA